MMKNKFIILSVIINPKISIFYFVLFSFLVYGIANALNPQKLWQIFQSWKSHTMPQQIYFRVKRIQGIVIVLFSILLLIQPFIERYIYMN